jgi:rhodanese-related sulfurtransferase
MRVYTPAELQPELEAGTVTVVDVRTPEEWELTHLPGSLHLPLQELPQRFGELRHRSNIVLVCHHGTRSEVAARFLEQNGFDNIAHLAGGLEAWADEVQPDMPRY